MTISFLPLNLYHHTYYAVSKQKWDDSKIRIEKQLFWTYNNSRLVPLEWV